jgi:hypothetical protein
MIFRKVKSSVASPNYAASRKQEMLIPETMVDNEQQRRTIHTTIIHDLV